MATPAHNIIRKFGGSAALAELLGVNVSTVLRWTYPRGRGGTGGVVPHWHHSRLYEIAELRGVKLRPVDFITTPKGRAA